MPRHFHNIEPHSTRRGCYSGYAHGTWRIEPRPHGWRARPVALSNEGRFHGFDARTLREVSAKLDALNAAPLPPVFEWYGKGATL